MKGKMRRKESGSKKKVEVFEGKEFFLEVRDNNNLFHFSREKKTSLFEESLSKWKDLITIALKLEKTIVIIIVRGYCFTAE